MAANEQTIIDALNDCVDRIATGASIEDCLRIYPAFASLLRPMLETVQAAKRSNYPSADMLGALERGRLRVQAALDEPPGGMNGAPRRPGGLGRFVLILLLLGGIGGGALLIGSRLSQVQPTATVAQTDALLPAFVLATNTVAPTETAAATGSASETPQPTASSTHTAVAQTEETARLATDDETPITTATATQTPTATASPTAEASATVTQTAAANATAQATATPTPTASSTVEASATMVAPEAASPTATPMTTIIVIEGPVTQINANAITIYSFTILVDVDDPILTVIRLDDLLRVEGQLDAEDGTITSSAVLIQNSLVMINPDTGEAWRDPGNCTNPPPAWAPADSWRRRCEGGTVGNGSGGSGGQTSGSSTSGGGSSSGSGGGGAPPPDDDDGGDADD